MKDSLIYTLHKLVFVLERQSDEALHSSFSFGFTQFKILTGAKYCAGLTQKDIANYLGQTEASVSRQLKIMSRQGLLVVKQDEQNRRRHTVVLTRKGEELTREAIEVLDATHASVFGSLSFKEQTMTKELIDRLITKATIKNGNGGKVAG